MNKYLFLALVCVSFPTFAAKKVLDCDNPRNTLEINECAAGKLDSAQAELSKYFAASLEHNKEDPKLVKAIEQAQKDWEVYMKAQCSAVYTQWRDGTIRNVMALDCKTQLTKERTHDIWMHFLTYMDSTPPVLPEPAKN
ncbi:lysozyme inhibitor LprI family protein [Photobacterium leiognathi]|uniref:lysozyme inhibitor LprI family protein n=1 Tax=Photobacterium leiognathi TaxID=553611 RepID=UPI002738DA8B|nr:lysozyme inhibitor LprI family protein [Photobacterium leiognathi]